MLRPSEMLSMLGQIDEDSNESHSMAPTNSAASDEASTFSNNSDRNYPIHQQMGAIHDGMPSICESSFDEGERINDVTNCTQQQCSDYYGGDETTPNISVLEHNSTICSNDEDDKELLLTDINETDFSSAKEANTDGYDYIGPKKTLEEEVEEEGGEAGDTETMNEERRIGEDTISLETKKKVLTDSESFGGVEGEAISQEKSLDQLACNVEDGRKSTTLFSEQSQQIYDEVDGDEVEGEDNQVDDEEVDEDDVECEDDGEWDERVLQVSASIGDEDSLREVSCHSLPLLPVAGTDLSADAPTAAKTRDETLSERKIRLGEIRRYMEDLRDKNDVKEFTDILGRSDFIRRAMAIGDIIKHKKMPFKVDGIPRSGYRSLLGEDSRSLAGSSNEMKMASVDSLPPLIRQDSLGKSRGSIQENRQSGTTTVTMRNGTHLPSTGRGGGQGTQPGGSRRNSAKSTKSGKSSSLPKLHGGASIAGSISAQSNADCSLSAASGSQVALLAKDLASVNASLAPSLSVSQGSKQPPVQQGTADTPGTRERKVPTGNGTKKKLTSQMIKEMEYDQELKAEKVKKALDRKLQHVLQLMEKAKDDVNPSACYYECGEVFYALDVFDRAAFCYENACNMSDSAKIIDTNILPNDLAYQRKIERMSPVMLPIFLKEREKNRQTYIYEESERQRLRKRSSHCLLSRIYLGLCSPLIAEAIGDTAIGAAANKKASITAQLALALRDLWKAQHHLREAFVCCKNEVEHNEMLSYFHGLIKEFYVSTV